MEITNLKSILRICLTLGLLAASAGFGQVSADVDTTLEEQTGLRTWEWSHEGITLQLVQRLPDQTRAFFMGRGFNYADADTIGRACVFQTIFRNDGNLPLTYNLNEWQVTYRDKPHSLQTRERWEQKWSDRDVKQAARIAFRWSLLPTRQGFEAGDYNWGMTSFGLPPGASFDLSLLLRVNEKIVRGQVQGVVCATDS